MAFSPEQARIARSLIEYPEDYQSPWWSDYMLRYAEKLIKALHSNDFPWIKTKEMLPPEREAPYQVMVCCSKSLSDSHQHYPKRCFRPDWVVRRFPDAFTHWQEAMPFPKDWELPSEEGKAK